MRILLLGEYSNVHTTLAEGLRVLGHEVVLASNGDYWKCYPRDVDLARPTGRLGGVKLLWRVLRLLPSWRNYDVVQLINPIFLDLKAEWCERIYKYLKKHNKKIILGAFGMDYYWVSECITRKPLKYSDFNIGERLREDTDALIAKEDWLGTRKERLNKLIARECDAIVTGLYEYDVCYRPLFPEKTEHIPYPIKNIECDPTQPSQNADCEKGPIKVFIGISRGRSEYKGTDIMLRAAERVAEENPQAMQLIKTEGVPFEEYTKLLASADVLLDQLYSYTPAMNALEAMARGTVVVGGGEEEHYELIGEEELRPIVNIQPTEESVYQQLTTLVQDGEWVKRLQAESVKYIAKHHEYKRVAAQYVKLYER